MSKESKIMTGVVAVLAGLLIGVFMIGNQGAPETTGSGAIPNADKLVREGSARTGSGPVTIVEFGDYQCPACATADPTLERILKEYEGKVSLVFRHYPLPQHKNAEPAAQAVEAAGEQGKFWEMHHKLYQNQSEWEKLPDAKDTFAEYAASLGLDGEKIKSAISTKKYADKITADKNDGNAVSVQGTPTFFINGIRANSFDYSTLKGLIDQALSQ